MKLTEKYTPKNLTEVIYPDAATKLRLQGYENGELTGNLLLHGAYGTGKTTIANLLAQAIGGNHYVVENKHFDELLGMKNIYDYLQVAAQIHVATRPKYFLIFNEFDRANQKNMDHFTDALDKAGSNVILIITTNYLSKIEGAVQDRCKPIYFPPITVPAVLPRAKEILKAESLDLPEQVLLNELKVAESSGGSIRRYMERLEELVYAHKCLVKKSPEEPTEALTHVQSTNSDSIQ